MPCLAQGSSVGVGGGGGLLDRSAGYAPGLFVFTQSKTGGRETPISARYERLKLAELTPSRSQRIEQIRGIALLEALSRLLEYPRVTSDSC